MAGFATTVPNLDWFFCYSLFEIGVRWMCTVYGNTVLYISGLVQYGMTNRKGIYSMFFDGWLIDSLCVRSLLK